MQGAGAVAEGPMLTVKEAADRLKVSSATTYALCEARCPQSMMAIVAVQKAGSELVPRGVPACR